jgi:hypothetical protein
MNSGASGQLFAEAKSWTEQKNVHSSFFHLLTLLAVCVYLPIPTILLD